MSRTKRMLAAVSTSALLAGAAAGPAAAATTTQDGLVNVNVGNVNVARDVDVGVAANLVANVCGVNVGPVQALASQVDATGTATAVCTSGGQSSACCRLANTAWGGAPQALRPPAGVARAVRPGPRTPRATRAPRRARSRG